MTTVEFLHSKGLKKWKNLQVTSDEHNRVIFLKELLEEYHEMKQKLLKHSVSGSCTDDDLEEMKRLAHQGLPDDCVKGWGEVKFCPNRQGDGNMCKWCSNYR